MSQNKRFDEDDLFDSPYLRNKHWWNVRNTLHGAPNTLSENQNHWADLHEAILERRRNITKETKQKKIDNDAVRREYIKQAQQKRESDQNETERRLVQMERDRRHRFKMNRHLSRRKSNQLIDANEPGILLPEGHELYDDNGVAKTEWIENPRITGQKSQANLLVLHDCLRLIHDRLEKLEIEFE